MLKSSMGRNASESPTGVGHQQEGGDDDFDTGPQSADFGAGGPEDRRQLRRPSVKDLASKFERGQTSSSAVRVATEVLKATDPNDLGDESQFQKLRRILTDLRGRTSGRGKQDAEEALNAIDALEVIHARQEVELAQGKGEVKHLSAQLKQISEDAEAKVGSTRSAYQAEIDAANEIAADARSALHEEQHRHGWTEAATRELEDLRRGADEVRRIRVLHESSRAMEMERQIIFLKQQVSDQTAESTKLRKELEQLKDRGRDAAGRHPWYQIVGDLQLGTTLSIGPVDGDTLDLSHCTIQWYQVADGRDPDLISGAIRPQYAPEPYDVGKFLRAEIGLPSGKTQSVQTRRPIEPSKGLDKYVETLVIKGGSQFNVRIVLKNGESVPRQPLHILDMNKVRIKLHKSLTVKAKEAYSSTMQLCGARGGGDSAAQGLFWVPKKGQTFMLVMESERERNAALLLAREFAKQAKVRLGGGGDTSPPRD